MVKSRTPPGDVASSADCIVAESNEQKKKKNQLDGSFGHELAESSSLFQSEVTPAENSKRHVYDSVYSCRFYWRYDKPLSIYSSFTDFTGL